MELPNPLHLALYFKIKMTKNILKYASGLDTLKHSKKAKRNREHGLAKWLLANKTAQTKKRILVVTALERRYNSYELPAAVWNTCRHGSYHSFKYVIISSYSAMAVPWFLFSCIVCVFISFNILWYLLFVLLHLIYGRGTFAELW